MNNMNSFHKFDIMFKAFEAFKMSDMEMTPSTVNVDDECGIDLGDVKIDLYQVAADLESTYDLATMSIHINTDYYIDRNPYYIIENQQTIEDIMCIFELSGEEFEKLLAIMQEHYEQNWEEQQHVCCHCCYRNC